MGVDLFWGDKKVLKFTMVIITQLSEYTSKTTEMYTING